MSEPFIVRKCLSHQIKFKTQVLRGVLTLFYPGYFTPHILPGGGAKLPTLSKILPEHTYKPKISQNVVQLFYF